MSLTELLAVFAVDVSCQLLRKDTGIPQYVLIALSMQCLGFLYAYSRQASLSSLGLHCDVLKGMSKETGTITCTGV